MRLVLLLTNTAAPPASVRGVWDVMLKAQGSGSEPIGNFIEDRLEAEVGGGGVKSGVEGVITPYLRPTVFSLRSAEPTHARGRRGLDGSDSL